MNCNPIDRVLRLCAGLAALGLLGCGGGGGFSNGVDVYPAEKPEALAVNGPDSFLLFPNPQRQLDG